VPPALLHGSFGCEVPTMAQGAWSYLRFDVYVAPRVRVTVSGIYEQFSKTMR
jgi:hypothetical protein